VEQVSAIPDVLAEVGPRLKRLRTHRSVTLTTVAAQTGISKSTLSRLESGQRKPSLELLLPFAEAYQVPLDELVGDPKSATLGSASSPAPATAGWSFRSHSRRADSPSGKS
jgi:transcriptional regulator with XRE-family HTH domain